MSNKFRFLFDIENYKSELMVFLKSFLTEEQIEQYKVLFNRRRDDLTTDEWRQMRRIERQIHLQEQINRADLKRAQEEVYENYKKRQFEASNRSSWQSTLSDLPIGKSSSHLRWIFQKCYLEQMLLPRQLNFKI